MWSAHSVIRSRRERLGFSQAEIAARLGVTKSFISYVETGKRKPTDDQIGVLADILRLPPDLLAFGLGRLPEDIRTTLENNAFEGVAAIRQRNESKAVFCPTAPQTMPISTADSATPEAPRSLPERIDVRKTSTPYRAHSYHTKVPPDAIRPFIRAFTQPGDTVFDPFCGSGMTGVAALIEGRNALLSDLSPAAVHIARNYITFCDPDMFESALEEVEKAIEPTIAWLYRPVGSDRIVEYTTWSDVYLCSACQNRLIYWEAVQRAGGTSHGHVTCPNCTPTTF